MRLKTTIGLGLLLGMLMAYPAANRNAEHWLNSHPSISTPYLLANDPAIFAVLWWGRLGLPHPSGEWGELRLLPYAIGIEWTLLGAIAGILWKVKVKRKHTQQSIAGYGPQAAAMRSPSHATNISSTARGPSPEP